MNKLDNYQKAYDLWKKTDLYGYTGLFLGATIAIDIFMMMILLMQGMITSLMLAGSVYVLPSVLAFQYMKKKYVTYRTEYIQLYMDHQITFQESLGQSLRSLKQQINKVEVVQEVPKIKEKCVDPLLEYPHRIPPTPLPSDFKPKVKKFVYKKDDHR